MRYNLHALIMILVLIPDAPFHDSSFLPDPEC
jgi:hypothetical protein